MESLMRATVKYGRAIQHVVTMFRHLTELKDEFDFEMSVDETDAPTTPLEHFFIASELMRAGVKFTSLAPRLIGRFEKGVDYIGDLSALDVELAKHAAVTAHFGTYKLSLHSGEEPQDAVNLGWAHGALMTTFPGDTTMATVEQVRAFAQGGSARIQR